MKLSYRGVSYDREPPILDIQEGDIAGKYRGQDWKYHYPRHIPEAPPKLYRQYRGVAYSTAPLPARDYHPPFPVAGQGTVCSVPRIQPKSVVKNHIPEIHLENMRRNLERRLKIAQANGDEGLIHLLEQESEQLTL